LPYTTEGLRLQPVNSSSEFISTAPSSSLSSSSHSAKACISAASVSISSGWSCEGGSLQLLKRIARVVGFHCDDRLLGPAVGRPVGSSSSESSSAWSQRRAMPEVDDNWHRLCRKPSCELCFVPVHGEKISTDYFFTRLARDMVVVMKMLENKSYSQEESRSNLDFWQHVQLSEKSRDLLSLN
jgi:hypothetical protein